MMYPLIQSVPHQVAVTIASTGTAPCSEASECPAVNQVAAAAALVQRDAWLCLAIYYLYIYRLCLIYRCLAKKTIVNHLKKKTFLAKKKCRISRCQFRIRSWLSKHPVEVPLA